MEQLPDDARAVLRMAAVSGKPTRLDVVVAAAASSRDEHALVPLLEQHQLVRVSTDRSDRIVECCHDRVRESVTGALDPDDLRGLHRAFADALAAVDDSDAETLAAH